VKYTLLQGNDPKKTAFAIQEGEKITQIEAKKGLETLRTLTAKGELSLGGKKLLFDPFLTFHVFIELYEETVHPYFLYKSQKIPFHVCPLIVHGALDFFVFEGIIRQFTGAFPKIERFFSRPLTLSPKEVQEFIDAYLVDPPEWGPKVEVVKERAQEPFIHPSFEASFLICLADETGAFIETETKNGTKEAIDRFFQDLEDAGYVYKPMQTSSYYCPTHKVLEALTLLHGMGYTVVGPKKEPILFSKEFVGTKKLHQKSFLVEGEYRSEKKSFSLKDALDAHKKGKVLLKNGDAYLFLDDSQLQVLQNVPKKWESQTLVIPRFYAPELLVRLDQTQIEGLIPMKEEVISQHFQGELFGFQKEGLDWLFFQYNNRFAALLADEMGLGKTVQTIAFLSSVLGDKKALIVAPLTLLTQWKQEITKFNPSLPVEIFDRKTTIPEKGVLLVSYQMLRACIEQFELIDYAVLVLDEAQGLKNKKTKGFEAVNRLRAEFKIALSGTPIENRITDLIHLFTLLLPDLAGEMDPKDLERVKNLTRPFILRRLKKDVVLQMPKKMEQLIYVDLYDEQKESYDLLREGHRKKIDESRQHVFSAILELRQHVLSPKLIDLDIPSAKLDRVLQDLFEHIENGQKVLVFSHFSSLLGLLKQELETEAVPLFYLDGKTKHRDQVVEGFKTFSGGCVFLMTLKAGGVGLNLVEADTVMLFEPWWNPQAEMQAIDRAHRVGREKPLIARRYIVLHSIEESMEQIKKDKSELADQMIEESAISSEVMEKLFQELF
jgi:superfamily II DNA or RNA helicase